MTKNKISKKRKDLFILFIVIIMIITMVLLRLTFENNKMYKIDTRIKAISNEKKKDKENFSTIGWLRVQGTEIDTPIVGFLNENERIKNYDVNKDNYLWNHNETEKIYNKVSIVGHNILNLSSKPESGLEYFSRFDDLMSFVYYDFAKENQYFQYTVDGQDYLYKIFGVYFDDNYLLDLYNKENYTKDEMKKFIKNVKNKTLYNYDVDINENDYFTSLVTCTRFFGPEPGKNFVVIGRRLRDNEKAKTYKVDVNKNYNQIKRIYNK